MSCKKISPPFPFPESWDVVRKYQVATSTYNWTVPSYSLEDIRLLYASNNNDIQPNSSFEYDDVDEEKDRHESDNKIEQSYNIIEEDEEDEVLVMNQEWVDRLSKAMKRKQKKAYKVNRNKFKSL